MGISRVVPVGRAAESARLAEALRAAATGRGAVLLLRGDPGVGKTTLLDQVAGTATGHRIVRLRGVQAEADLAYSGLHVLCSSLANERERLAPHQRAALDGVIGLRAGTPTGRIVLGAATLALLRRAAESRPLLCVVDDAHWVDRASAQAIAFAARRLTDAPVALLLAGTTPTGQDEFAGLPRLDVAGLRQTDARRLLAMASTGPLDEAVAERIVVESGGNPRALVTAMRGADPARLAGGYGIPAPERTAGDVVAGLAPDSRLFLILAAAEPVGDPARIWRAAGELAIPVDAGAHLEAAGLLSFGTRVVFRDAALRPVVYGLATTTERRRVHRALAAATDPESDADRRAWHSSRAAIAPDATLADELARCATTALDRGGLTAQAAFLEQAALHTPDPALRAHRALDAAEVHHEAGSPETAAGLLATAELGPGDPLLRARVDRLHGRARFDATRSGEPVHRLLRAARELRSAAPELATQGYLDALCAAIFAGGRGANGELAEVARQVRMRPSDLSNRPVDLLLDGVATRCLDGYAASVEPLKLAAKAVQCDEDGDCPRVASLACLVARDLWDDDAWHDVTDVAVRRAGATGVRTALPYVLTQRALLEVHSGQFDAARDLVVEADAITDAVGTPRFGAAAALVAAWHGHDHAAQEIGRLRRDAEDRREGLAVTASWYATAVLCNGLAQYDQALTAARAAAERDDLGLLGGALAELVEAAVRRADRATAEAATERLAERACLSGTDWALGVEARCRALLGDGREAEDHYVEAIERLGRCRMATELARARLVYGEWLRRQGRRVDARVPLRAARDSFTAMGATAFGERAHRELLATGERVRRRVPETEGRLTPQETRIALLARDGRSNPQIATRLAISPRTVEYHLRKVFIKLGVTSRTELHLVFPADQDRVAAGSPDRTIVARTS